MIKVANNKVADVTPGYIINIIITIALMIGFKYVPPTEPLTPLGMEVIGIFLGMLYGWLVVGDLYFPSIAGLIFLGLSDYTTVPDALRMGFGNSTVLLLFFFFMFTNIIADAGITNHIALWLSRRKFAQGKPYALSFLLAFTMFVLVIMVSATAACLIMFPIIKQVAKLYGFVPGDAWPKHMIIGATYVACVGYMLLPFKSLPVVVLASYAEMSGESIPYGPYILVTIALTTASMIVFLLGMKFILKPDVSKIIEHKNVTMESLPKLTRYQKIVFGYFLLVVLILLIPTFFPQSWGITILVNNIGSAGILAISVVAFTALKLFRDNGKISTFQNLTEHGISWSCLLLLAAALTIASAITHESTGVSSWLANIITPLVSGRNPLFLLAFLCLIGAVLTNLSNNVATAAILVPIAYIIGESCGANTVALTICIMNSCNIGLITPPASAPASLLHGDAEWIGGKTAFVDGCLWTVSNYILILVLMYPLISVSI